jgi:signal transduction histidine kinase
VSLRNDRSVRVRMTLLSSAVMALLSAVFCVLLLVIAHKEAVNTQEDRILLANLKVVHRVLRAPLPPVLPDFGIAAVQVVDPTDRMVAASVSAAGKPRMATFTLPDESMRQERISCDLPGFPDMCMVVVGIKTHKNGGDWLVYGADQVIPWYISGPLLAALLGGAVLLVGATAIGAYRTVSRTLAPVDAICAELAEITSTDLGRRVPVSEHRDEISGLAETVNRTLSRLEEAVEQQRRFAEQQRRFAADASHDLRSPITAMRTQVEEALLYPDETHWPATAQALLDSLDRLEAIVIDLLVLARLDSGVLSADEPVDLSELITSEVTRRAPRMCLATDLQPGVVVLGDRLQLARLLTNLVDNAARHAAATVTVKVCREGDDAVVEVIDDGPGIPPDKREFVFQRFTRLDPARTKDRGGTGLGLAIAREIAERHGGTLTIEDSEQGARFVLRIPIVEQPGD